jgi:hypothetical protein
MPDGAEIQHRDGSTTVIEQDPSGDYHVYDVMPDGSAQQRGDFGSAHTLDQMIEMFSRSDDPDPSEASTDASNDDSAAGDDEPEGNDDSAPGDDDGNADRESGDGDPGDVVDGDASEN